MTNVLVCVKRVPDVSGEVALTADGQAVDARQVGFTISDHEACAVELAVRVATDTGGTATVATVGTAEAVEQLRNADGGFDLEVSIVHPGGVSELYLGQVKGPRIDLATDAVMRTSGAKDYAAATRLYGLVEGHLLWAWDIAALGQDLRTHASARLAKAD